VPQTLGQAGGETDFETARVELRLELDQIEDPVFGRGESVGSVSLVVL
jgi:hypothetical protein